MVQRPAAASSGCTLNPPGSGAPITEAERTARHVGRAGRLLKRTVTHLQCGLRALRDHLALVLSHGGKDMHRQLIGMGVINGNELNARFH